MSFAYEETFPFSRTGRVMITVGHPPGHGTPDLAAPLSERIGRIAGTQFRADHPVTIGVRYVAADGSTGATDAGRVMTPRSVRRGVGKPVPSRGSPAA